MIEHRWSDQLSFSAISEVTVVTVLKWLTVRMDRPPSWYATIHSSQLNQVIPPSVGRRNEYRYQRTLGRKH